VNRRATEEIAMQREKVKMLSMIVAAMLAASSASAENANVRYHDHFYFSGFFLRAAKVCDEKKYIYLAARLISTPELKKVGAAFPETTKQWMFSGADDFNDGVMRGGIKKACAWAPNVYAKFVAKLNR
jgi:hypothetical protein